MKLTLIILGIVIGVLAIVAAINYFRQKRRQQFAEREGVVVYATVVSAEPVGGWAKQLDMKKITLRVQEPNGDPREVTLRTRTAPGQQITAGVRLVVVVDPKDAKRVYPASPEAAKRVVVTGSRMERRLMQSQLRSPSRGPQRPPSGYQPPINKIR